MKIPKYPNDFFDFGDGVNVHNDEINRWIADCIDQLENDKESNAYSISSGNTFVEVRRRSEGMKYEIFVSKSHATAEIYEEE